MLGASLFSMRICGSPFAFFSRHLFCFTKFQSNELNGKILHSNRYMKRLKPNTYITKICVSDDGAALTSMTENERRDNAIKREWDMDTAIEKLYNERKREKMSEPEGEKQQHTHTHTRMCGGMVDAVRCVSCR